MKTDTEKLLEVETAFNALVKEKVVNEQTIAAQTELIKTLGKALLKANKRLTISGWDIKGNADALAAYHAWLKEQR